MDARALAFASNVAFEYLSAATAKCLAIVECPVLSELDREVPTYKVGDAVTGWAALDASRRIQRVVRGGRKR